MEKLDYFSFLGKAAYTVFGQEATLLELDL